ncbi:conserved hypothetical protein [Luteimonas sp. 9C]|uniref:DUF3426 domain-containing protein n=1 Tax=Luteimonas sp. 9C TaxID=2653148 RepID=UPI0012F055A5|nr:DUF3426 domain-containing protein [Luteimonas sp. 9C]VXA92265.1 conserved hypothetical protein [Luteimonas sp. 9C]
MFINCKHCGSLVATDPATDQPPERCPRCRGVLRSAAPQVSVASLLKAPTQVADREAPERAPPPAAAALAPVPPALDAVDESAASRPEPPPQVVATDPGVATPVPADAIAPVETDAGAGDATHSTSIEAPTAAVTPVAAPAPPSAPARTSPSFVRRGATAPTDPHARRQHRLLVGAAVALTLLLGLQVLLADRARLARDPGWRPALAGLCSVLRCSLPPWHEPTALTVLARDVRPDDARPGELVATATFRNEARWAQAWPALRLTLSDIDGRAVGTRVFTPQEYLDVATYPPTLAAGDSAQARLQLVEPDTRAVSFAFDFL